MICNNCCYCSSCKKTCPFFHDPFGGMEKGKLRSAARRDPAAALYLAYAEFYGLYGKKDEKGALSDVEKLARKGYPPAACFLAAFYEAGLFPSLSAAEVFALSLPAANDGCTRAEAYIGRAYRDGKGVAKNPKAAREYLGYAAFHGFSEAYWEYADACCDTAGGTPDLKTACEVLQWAADEGDQAAAARIVQMHRTDMEGCFGSQVGSLPELRERELGDYCLSNPYHKDPGQAFSHYHAALTELKKKKAEGNASIYLDRDLARMQEKKESCISLFFEAAPAEQQTVYRGALAGDAQAQFRLSCLYYDRSFPLYDAENAFLWVKKSAEGGHATAALRLGYFYIVGFGTQKNPAEAFRWTRFAAEQGNADGMFNLGWCYSEGFGVEKNYLTAYDWYLAAAERGHSKAQYSVALYDEGGHGRNGRDLALAAAWLEKAALQKHSLAALRLGAYYSCGWGVDVSFEKGAAWYLAAAEQGEALAMHNLGVCYYEGRGVKQDYGEAFRWLTRASDLGIAAAQNNLAACYYYGRGVERDYGKARDLLLFAANGGNEKAKRNKKACDAIFE